MKRLLALFAVSFIVCNIQSQSYIKLNGLYALAGVINPAVEFRISPKSTFQSEIIYSPWQSITLGGVSGPMKFGILMNEYRRYFKEANNGWYMGLNGSVMAFHMRKPTFGGGKLSLGDKETKGYGIMFGLSGGYEFKIAERWMIDTFIGFGFSSSFYNGYLDGDIIMEPNRPVQPEKPDPFNGSSEWLPNKIGVSISYMIINPHKK